MTIGDPVLRTGKPLSVELGPGMLPFSIPRLVKERGRQANGMSTVLIAIRGLMV
jgi:hypothetical protein